MSHLFLYIYLASAFFSFLGAVSSAEQEYVLHLSGLIGYLVLVFCPAVNTIMGTLVIMGYIAHVCSTFFRKIPDPVIWRKK